MSKDTKLKIGDWVHVLIVGFRAGEYKNEPAYQIESIDGDDYTVVQTEGSYEHRVTVKKGKLKKL
ncbi:hypothetical protein HOE22_09380 [Candidatus Woesearchaeota archaeon]|jgi:hypothetical protein|nr:hypothetical protein [Candidatus Woesearchaeota archaeon]MBT4732616.1 hypothetical protein [Candidatus Woesearchaeota archaeon]MBT7557468.1 hypothetical protein [Candidatus Woesearchaeota archaeon]